VGGLWKAELCLMIWQNRSQADLERDADFLAKQVEAVKHEKSRYLSAGFDLEKTRFFYPWE